MSSRRDFGLPSAGSVSVFLGAFLPVAICLPQVRHEYFGYMPLLKKNDAQDASKREVNTAHIGAFAPSHPEAGSSEERCRFFNPDFPDCRAAGSVPVQGAIKPLLIAAHTHIG
jgi:hypothetical protein